MSFVACKNQSLQKSKIQFLLKAIQAIIMARWNYSRAIIMQYLLFNALVTFLITSFAIWILRPVAIHLHWVAMPSERKKHDGDVPLIGGVAMLFGLSIGLLMMKHSLLPYRVLLASCLFIAFFGVLDDLHELSHKKKFWVQIFAACLLVILGHTQLTTLGNLFSLGVIPLKALTIPFSVLAVVVVINAMNMLDGVDGLLGSVSFVQFGLLAFLAYFFGDWGQFSIIILIMSALLGFLVFNFPLFKKQAFVFMGDTGSMFIGLLLAYFLMTLPNVHHFMTHPIVFLWIIALPIFDMLHVMIFRIRQHKSPFHADRQHFHHLLQKRGLADLSVTLISAAYALFLGLIAFWLSYLKVSDLWLFILWIVLFCLHLTAVHYLRQD